MAADITSVTITIGRKGGGTDKVTLVKPENKSGKWAHWTCPPGTTIVADFTKVYTPRKAEKAKGK